MKSTGLGKALISIMVIMVIISVAEALHYPDRCEYICSRICDGNMTEACLKNCKINYCGRPPAGFGGAAYSPGRKSEDSVGQN
ncbi:hypothetical protein ABFS82_09G101100 [Erythranthe guttata]